MVSLAYPQAIIGGLRYQTFYNQGELNSLAPVTARIIGSCDGQFFWHPSLFVEFLGLFENLETLYRTVLVYCNGISRKRRPFSFLTKLYFSSSFQKKKRKKKKGDLTKQISIPLPQETVQNISKQILEGLKVRHQQAGDGSSGTKACGIVLTAEHLA